MKDFFKNTSLQPFRRTIGVWVGIFLICAVIFAYNSNKGPLQASIKYRNTADTTKTLDLNRFDQTYTTIIPFFKDSLSIVYKNCEHTKIQVVLEKDSLVIINGETDRPVLYGKIYMLSDSKTTLVGLASNFVGTKVPFTLTRILPDYADPNDPTSLLLLLHINDKKAPYFVLSQKKTCGELKEYLKIQ